MRHCPPPALLPRGSTGLVVSPGAMAGPERRCGTTAPGRRGEQPVPGSSSVCGEPRGCAAAEMCAGQLPPGHGWTAVGLQVRAAGRGGVRRRQGGSWRAGWGVVAESAAPGKGGGGRGLGKFLPRRERRRLRRRPREGLSPAICGGASAAPLPPNPEKRRRGGKSALARGCPVVGVMGCGHIISGEWRRQGRVAQRGFKPGRDGTGRDGRLPAPARTGLRDPRQARHIAPPRQRLLRRSCWLRPGPCWRGGDPFAASSLAPAGGPEVQRREPVCR